MPLEASDVVVPEPALELAVPDGVVGEDDALAALLELGGLALEAGAGAVDDGAGLVLGGGVVVVVVAKGSTYC